MACTMVTGPPRSLSPALPVTRSDKPIHTIRQKSTQLYQLLRISLPKVASS